MASTQFLFCGPCENRKAHRQANVWCSVCLEGLCKECEQLHTSSKLSKGHTTFDDNHYPLLKPFLKSLQINCEKHNKRYDFYCQDHSALCCVNCVTEKHRQCGEVQPVDDQSKSLRASTAFTKLEQGFITILQTIDEAKSNRTENIKLLDEQKNSIQLEIKGVRKALNDHLDNLEKKILDDLNTAEQRHSIDIAQIVFEIDTRKQFLLDLQTIASCVKQIDSGIQALLATKKVEDMFLSEKKMLDSILSDKGSEELQLCLHLSDKIKSLNLDLKTFGTVETKDSKPIKPVIVVDEKRGSTKSLALPVPETTQDPSRIMLRLIKKIKTSKRKSKIATDLRGCVILSDGKLLFADWSDNKKLTIFNVEGTHARDIGLIGKPYDITRLDGERIAVSFPEDYVVQIFDVIGNGYPIYQNIKMADQCWGIFYNNDKLFVGCNGHKVQIMDLSGHIVKTVPAKVNTVYCLHVDANFVYYTDEINNTVFCCDFDGNEIWKFRDPSLKYPCSVACSPTGYVFVVGTISQNVMVMAPNGQQSKSLLSKLDGLDGPAGIHYDAQSNRLVVVLASFKGLVALYDVITKPQSLHF